MSAWGREDLELVAAPKFGPNDPVSKLHEFRQRLEDPGARKLLDYWSGLVSVYGLAIKRRFDPLAIPDLLPRIYLEEWDAPTEQSKVRLEGDVLRDLWGGGAVGKTIDDQVTGAVNALWKESDRLNFGERRGTFEVYDLNFRDREYRWVGDLCLPMEDERGEPFSVGYIWDL